MKEKSFRRSGMLLLVAIVLCLGNCMRVVHSGTRAVEIVSLLGLGIAFGAGITHLSMYLALRKKMKMD